MGLIEGIEEGSAFQDIITKAIGRFSADYRSDARNTLHTVVQYAGLSVTGWAKYIHEHSLEVYPEEVRMKVVVALSQAHQAMLEEDHRPVVPEHAAEAPAPEGVPSPPVPQLPVVDFPVAGAPVVGVITRQGTSTSWG